MENVEISDNEEVDVEETLQKPKPKRVMSDAQKEILKKGREIARLNREKKNNPEPVVESVPEVKEVKPKRKYVKKLKVETEKPSPDIIYDIVNTEHNNELSKSTKKINTKKVIKPVVEPVVKPVVEPVVEKVKSVKKTKKVVVQEERSPSPPPVQTKKVRKPRVPKEESHVVPVQQFQPQIPQRLMQVHRPLIFV